MSAASQAVTAITTFAWLQCDLSDWAQARGCRDAAEWLIRQASIADAAARQIAVASGEPGLIALWEAQ